MLRQGALSLAALVALGMTTAACGGSSSQQEKSSGSSPLTVGVIGQLSGPAGSLPGFTDGAVAYLRHVNEQGGVNGHQLAWKTADGADNGTQVVSIARQMIGHVDAIISIGSPVVTVLKPLASSLDAPFVISAGGDLFHPPVKNLYTVNLSYASQYEFAAQEAKSELNADSVSVVYAENAFGAPAESAVPAYANKNGIQVKTSVGVPLTVASYTAYAQRLKSAGAPVVIAALETTQIPGLVRAASSIGYAPKWILPSSGISPSTIEPIPESDRTSLYAVGYTPQIGTRSNDNAEYWDAMEKYAPKYVSDALALSGWNNSAVIVAALKDATAGGGKATTERVEAGLNKLHDAKIGLVSGLTYDSTQHYGVTKLQFLHYQSGVFNPTTDFMDAPKPLS